MENVLYYGKQVSANPAEILTPITPEALHKTICCPEAVLTTHIARLRQLQLLDPKKYQQQKIFLPYFTGSLFNAFVRNQTNFISTEWFVLDIDEINTLQTSVQDLKNYLKTDNRIWLMFTSPGGNGLKLLFRLHQKCYDPLQYSMFYKKFASVFSQQYNLQECLDTTTSDVARVCFLSADPEAHFNPIADTVFASSFVDYENSIFEAANVIKEQKAGQQTFAQAEKTELKPDTLEFILKQLNPERRTKPVKHIFVPDALENIILPITEKAAGFNIILKEVSDINYGKKLVFEKDRLFAELNVFYGKNGFSVIKTTKRGSSSQLAEVMFQMLCEVLY